MKSLRCRPARFLLGSGLLLGAALMVAAPSLEKKWSFDSDTEGSPPPGFTFARTGQGSEGQWVVTRDESAPSKSKVLAQTSKDKTDYRFPLAIAEGTSYKDFALSVHFKSVSGEVDQAAGLSFRLRDKDNYYVVRANALENNYRLYHVINGRRVQFAGANVEVTARVWHEMRVEARGPEIRCFFDGQIKITAQDSTFPDAGGIGLWTKADSVTYFDDLTVQELGTTQSMVPPAKTLAQRLVNELAKNDPEIVRIGLHISPPGSAENIIIASNIAAKIGQKSDPEDLQAMKTGKPVVLQEGANFDVTLALHDAGGKLIGAIGLTLKPAGSEPTNEALRRARSITSAFEKRIPSKNSLFGS